MGSVNTVRDVIEGGRDRTDRTGDRPPVRNGAIGRCFDCRRDGDTARSCTTTTITFPDGTVRAAIRYGEGADGAPADRCLDCGVSIGGYHHPFCSVEPCPRCGGRLAACSCLDSDKTR